MSGRSIRFTLSGEAVPKDRPRHRIVSPPGRKAFVHVYTPKATEDYEKRIAARARKVWGAPPSMRPIELQVTIYVEIPAAWPKWKREAAGRGEVCPTSVPDVDNVVKSVADAMNGIVYRDDSQIVTIDAVKMHAPLGEDGYLDVQVRENYRCASWITRLADFVLLR